MPALLVVLLVLVPLLELVVIIQVAGVIGMAWTIALLVATCIIGAYLLSRESRRAWRDFRVALSEGRFPGDEVTQGALIIVGGTLLLAPGFVTDVVGLLCLLPFSRPLVARIVRRRLVPGAILGGGPGAPPRGSRPGRGRGVGPGPGRGAGPGAAQDGASVYDVEVVDIQREPLPERDETLPERDEP